MILLIASSINLLIAFKITLWMPFLNATLICQMHFGYNLVVHQTHKNSRIIFLKMHAMKSFFWNKLEKELCIEIPSYIKHGFK